jgi:hypothetical protein
MVDTKGDSCREIRKVLMRMGPPPSAKTTGCALSSLFRMAELAK